MHDSYLLTKLTIPDMHQPFVLPVRHSHWRRGFSFIVSTVLPGALPVGLRSTCLLLVLSHLSVVFLCEGRCRPVSFGVEMRLEGALLGFLFDL